MHPDPLRDPAPDWSAAIPSMQRAARRVLGSDDLAHDAVQDALVHAWTHGRLEHSAPGALCCLAHLTGLEIRRSRGRAARRDDAVAATRPTASTAEDPATIAEHHDCARHVLASLATLPDDCRDALRRFLVDEQPYATIAAETGVPIGTVRSRIARARRLLQEHLTASGLAPADARDRRAG